MDIPTAGQKIQMMRSRVELTQKQLAELVGVNQNTVQRWENDQNEPKAKDAIRLARALGTTVEDLYDDYAEEVTQYTVKQIAAEFTEEMNQLNELSEQIKLKYNKILSIARKTRSP